MDQMRLQVKVFPVKFDPRRRSGGPPSSLRSILLLLVAAGLLLVPASQAAAAKFPLSVVNDGSGTGTVKCDVEGGGAEPCDAEYEEGTELTLVPEAEPGSEFVEFSGDCGPAECELVMNEAHGVTATFEAQVESFPLTVETAGNGSGTVECEVEAGPEPCEEQYPEGTELSLVAEPEPGSEFVEWLGDCGPEDCELVMDSDHEVIALFELEPEEFTLEIDLAGTGTGEVECEAQEGPETCQSTYLEGTELTLIPQAGAKSKFIEFSGACAGVTCELTMEADREVTATFEKEPGAEFTLTVSEAGTGTGEVKCKADGGPAEACDPEYEEGTELSLIATADPGSEFAGFSSGIGSASGCSASPCNFTITADSSVTATFEPVPEYELEISTDGTGTGEVECKVDGGSAEACEAEYEEGTEIALVPVADPGSEFVQWSGDCTGSGACVLTMTEDKEVTATFDEEEPAEEFSLTVSRAGTGSGTVTSSPAGIDCGSTCTAEYEESEEVTLTASAVSGSTFSGWSGAGCSGTSTCKVTIDKDTTVTATFTANPTPPPPTCATDPSLCPPPPPPAEGKAKAAATAKVKSGKASLKLTCSGGPCKGTLKLTAKVKQGSKTKSLQIGKASFSLAEGATATLKVKLSGPAKTELSKGRVLKAKTSGTGVVASMVKIKPAKK